MDLYSISPPTPRDLLVWQHATACLRAGIPATLLLVVSSQGSSPGRQGFKMSVAPGSMAGSVGGGIMEHKFVELARFQMAAHQTTVVLREQIHSSEAAHNRSGMICSGQQTLVLLPLQASHLPALHFILNVMQHDGNGWFDLEADGSLHTGAGQPPGSLGFHAAPRAPWHYTEMLGFRDQLTIVGGGHVALALSRVAATLDFRIRVFDDRPGLNTLLINPYAHEKRTLPYNELADNVLEGPHEYVVLMTFGYRSDALAMRQLLHHRLAYLGLMGSAAKVAELLNDLRAEGYSEEAIARAYAPVGLPIHSRTPEEIAISIAADLIRVRNVDFHDAR